MKRFSSSLSSPFSPVAVLCAAAAFSLSSCTREEEERTRINLWHQMALAERPILEEAVKEFERRHPHVDVTVLYRETEELRSGFQNSALAGGGPELVYGPADQVAPFAAMGIIAPLDDLLPRSFIDSQIPKALTYLVEKGPGGPRRRLYQVGDRVGNHLALVYNRALVPEPPRTTDELMEIARRVGGDTDGDGRRDRYGLVFNFTEPFFFVPFLAGFGGWVMDEEGNPTLNTPAAIKAFRFILKLRDLGVIPRECDYETSETLFKEGRAAMTINGDWAWGGYRKAGVDFGIARIPKVSETGLWPAPMVSPKGYSLNRNAKGKKRDTALELLMFLTSAEVEARFTEALGTLPGSKAANELPQVKRNPLLAASLRQIEVGRPMPVVPELRAVWDAMRPSYQGILGGTLSPEEAAGKMQREALRKIAIMNQELKPHAYLSTLKWVALGGAALLTLLLLLWTLRLLRDARARPFPYLLLLPSALVMAAAVLYPFAYNLAISLSNMSLRRFSDWEIVGFDHYAAVFTDPVFYRVLWKTLFWTFSNVALHISIGVLLALCLNRAIPGKTVFRALLIVPWAVPQAITALSWRGLFNQEYGAVNLLLERIGLGSVPWLTTPGGAFAACLITNVWLGFPFMMVVALGGLQAIPKTLYEAAEVDGAGAFARFRAVTLPGLKPVMAPAAILGIVWTFNNLNVIWLVSNGGEPSDQTHILVSYVYKAAFNQYNYAYAAALSVVIFAILLFLGLLSLRRAKAVEAAP